MLINLEKAYSLCASRLLAEAKAKAVTRKYRDKKYGKSTAYIDAVEEKSRALTRLLLKSTGKTHAALQRRNQRLTDALYRVGRFS